MTPATDGLISVVIPFYQSRRYIRTCIESLLGQDCPADRYEIIMVDNNSSDDSPAIVREYSRIRLISEAKQGAYAARNKGLRAASGEVVAFTDADCQVDPTWLSRIGQAMRDPRIGIVLGRSVFNSACREVCFLNAYEEQKNADICDSLDSSLYYGYTNNMAVRRNLFERCGDFVEISRGADSLFVRKVVDTFGCSCVSYQSNVLIRHLEIVTVLDYFRKRLAYGHSHQRCREIGGARALSTGERLRVFHQMVQRQGYGMREITSGIVLLTAGACCFAAGRLRGVFGRSG